VQGYAWEDTNENSLINQNETKLSNIEVRLYSDSGSLIGTTTTSNEGYYSFTDLQNGRYYVEFGIPNNYQIVTHLGTIAVDPATGKSENFIISDTSRSVTVGIGMKPGSENPDHGNGGQESKPTEQSSGGGQTIPGSVSITASEDTTASQFQPSANSGNMGSLCLQDNSQVYLRFPLGELPDVFSLVSAVLNLSISNSSHPADAQAAITFPAQNPPWQEGTLTWANMPPQATGAPALYSQLVDNPGGGEMDSFDVTELFRAYLQAFPGATHLDLMLSYFQGEYLAQCWHSRESQMPPQLVVNYSTTSP